MKNPLKFYIENKAILEAAALILKKKSVNLSIFRFAIFLTTCLLGYLTSADFSAISMIVFLGVLPFGFLVIHQNNLKKKKAILDTKIRINQIEIQVLKGHFHSLEAGLEFIDSSHFYSNDIDLFGVGSFFQYVNRTDTHEGKKMLAGKLTENKIDRILDRQKAIEELSKKVTWRQNFSALASLVTVKNTAGFIVNWIQNYTPIFSRFLKIIPVVFSLSSLLIVGLVSFRFVPFSVLVIWFFTGLFISGINFKKTQKLYAETNAVRETFKQYHQLLNEIENEKFTTKNLKEKQAVINSEEKKASVIFKEFAKALDAFDQRNNLIIAVFGNGLFLWDIKNACKVENWISKYHHTAEKWFEVVAYFDAQNSLANFHFNHPKFIFPEITSSKEIVKVALLGHPLLKADKRVDNDFTIYKGQFFIVTGANMAGKSTFLRTISLSIVMANCGLPVCAKEFKYSPIKLITSMRTTDSLTEDESYFYSELKRLKFIVDEIKNDDYFIILDEILKGTNSKDKAIGSKKFVEKLSNSKSTGIIATHDVSLCELENEFADIENYYFDAEIIEDELHFDYTLKNGICKNMNASFLLEKMEIV
jgi:hypothetical protein